jgi:regulation of enolase protein 1 (concanavalin A-like superfamily)
VTVIPGIPFELTASSEAVWRVDPDGSVRVTAAPRSDVFVDPGRGVVPDAEGRTNAAVLLGSPPDGDFQLSARVDVEFAATYDAGVLLVWAGERDWAKLCFEFSPDGEPMVVSVVCRGVADDANAFTVDGRSVRLRVSRLGEAFAFHASTDGTTWRLIRHFALAAPADTVTVGFEAQSPAGDGCAVAFDDVRFAPTRLEDLRDGS